MSATRVAAHLPGERRTTPLAHDMRAPAATPKGVGILLAMTTPLRTRVYVMTIAVLVCVVGPGACLGFLVADWSGALVGAGAAGLGAGFGMLPGPRGLPSGATAMPKGSPTWSC